MLSAQCVCEMPCSQSHTYQQTHWGLFLSSMQYWQRPQTDQNTAVRSGPLPWTAHHRRTACHPNRPPNPCICKGVRRIYRVHCRWGLKLKLSLAALRCSHYISKRSGLQAYTRLQDDCEPSEKIFQWPIEFCHFLMWTQRLNHWFTTGGFYSVRFTHGLSEKKTWFEHKAKGTIACRKS